MSLKPRERPSLKSQMEAVEHWNAKYTEGTVVHVRLDDGSQMTTQTASEAWLLGGHTAVILVDGISGAYSLSHCTPDE